MKITINKKQALNVAIMLLRAAANDNIKNITIDFNKGVPAPKTPAVDDNTLPADILKMFK